MSIILVIFLILLSLHSCNARVFKVDHSHHAKELLLLPISKENDEKLLVLSEGEQEVKTVGNAEIGKKEISVVITESSAGSEEISFKVPQKKGGDEDKELFIDYTPPRTHPPSHN